MAGCGIRSSWRFTPTTALARKSLEVSFMALPSPQVIELFQRYVIGNYTRYPVCLVRGEGSWVWDAEGNRYLDFFPGWGCGILGHCPPRVVQAVQEQVATLIHVPNTWYTEPQVLLAQALGERTDFA